MPTSDYTETWAPDAAFLALVKQTLSQVEEKFPAIQSASGGEVGNG